MGATLSRFVSSALDLLLPLSCAVCRRDGRALCAGCEAVLPRLEEPFCSICAAPGTSQACRWCALAPLAIDGIRAPYLFQGAMRDMIHNLKYNNVRALAPELGGLLTAYLGAHRIPCDVLVPVPLHPRRERRRGYNQAELLAREVSKGTGIPVEAGALRRIRDTPPQVSMKSHEDRRRLIQGAFEGTSGLAGHRVLLIDDVVTTGSTMSDCARATKAAGARSVWGLALAR